MDKEKILEEMQNVIEAAKKENRGLNEAEEKQYSELEQRLNVAKKEDSTRKMQDELRAQKKAETPEQKEEINEIRQELMRGVMEKRAITVNGAGATGYIRDIVMAKIEKSPWMSQIDMIYVPNANTSIPILTPLPANGGYYAEGSTSVTVDSTAVLAAQTLTPRAYISLLQISKQGLTFTALESQIDRALQRVFSNTLHEQIVTGSGTNQFTGLDVVTGKTSVNTAAVAITGLINLIIKAKGKLDNPIVLINDDAYSTIIGANPTSPIVAAMMATGTLMGVPIYTTSNLADGGSSAEVWAVCFEGANYAVGVAGELMVDTINVKGDANTYFQAYMFADGKSKINAEVFYNAYSGI